MVIRNEQSRTANIRSDHGFRGWAEMETLKVARSLRRSPLRKEREDRLTQRTQSAQRSEARAM
jgi:hypothetical protein